MAFRPASFLQRYKSVEPKKEIFMLSILIVVTVGLVLGWLANILIEGHGLGAAGDIGAGVAGAFLASTIYSKLYIDHSTGGFIAAAIFGALFFLVPIALFATPSKRRLL